MPVSAFFHAVVLINKWSSLSRASLKSVLIMSEVGAAQVLPRAAVEFVHSFSLSTVHIYFFFCIILCLFGQLSSTTNKEK